MERIWGPVNGFYFAAYASAVADGERFVSYAKVCWTRPTSYWEADCAFKLFGGEHHPSQAQALAAVMAQASSEVFRLPPQARTLAERRQQDHVAVPRLLVSGFFNHRLA